MINENSLEKENNLNDPIKDRSLSTRYHIESKLDLKRGKNLAKNQIDILKPALKHTRTNEYFSRSLE